MRTIGCSIALAVLLAAMPGVVGAATGLRGIMHEWRAGAREAGHMFGGRAVFDEAALRRTLQGYVDDSGRIATQIDGRTADSRDIRQRFAAFQADSRAALDTLGQRASAKAAFSRIMSDCQSCHDQYNN